VKWYGKYGRKANRIVKRFGKYTQSSSSSNRVEIPPKTRYKQTQNETHYENITH
jgi:hypothetical protein